MIKYCEDTGPSEPAERRSLRVKTQLLSCFQREIVVDSATHSQKDGVEGNVCSLMYGADGADGAFDA